jgi:hypothetical protein
MQACVGDKALRDIISTDVTRIAFDRRTAAVLFCLGS